MFRNVKNYDPYSWKSEKCSIFFAQIYIFKNPAVQCSYPLFPKTIWHLFLTGGVLWIFFGTHFIQHCPSNSTVSEDAGIEPRTVATKALDVKRSSPTRLHLIRLFLYMIFYGGNHQLEVSDCRNVIVRNLFLDNNSSNNLSTVILWNIQQLNLTEGGKIFQI
jgi:hypothetical protein